MGLKPCLNSESRPFPFPWLSKPRCMQMLRARGWGERSRVGRRGECSCPGDESRETVENIYCWRMKTRSGNGGEQKLMRPEWEAGWQEVILELSDSVILSPALNQNRQQFYLSSFAFRIKHILSLEECIGIVCANDWVSKILYVCCSPQQIIWRVTGSG